MTPFSKPALYTKTGPSCPGQIVMGPSKDIWCYPDSPELNMVMVPLFGDFLEGSLLEFVEFLQRDNVGLLFGDPLRSDLRGLAMVEAQEDVVGEDAEGLSLGSIGAEEDNADEEGTDHGVDGKGSVRIHHSSITIAR
jgi:hypothetical protein